MVEENERKTHKRRDVLKYSVAAGLVGLAGCSTTDGGTTPTDGGDGSTPTDEGDGATPTESGDGGDGMSGSYTIGMINSLTGSLADFGARNKRGKNLALSQVNEVGINGRDLNIEVQDSGSTQQSGVSAAQNLVNQAGVPFIIGAVGSGVSLSIYTSVVQGTDVVQLSQNSTGLGLTDYPDLLRISPSGLSQSIALSNIIAEDGHDSVAVTWVNNNYGQSLADAFMNNWDGDVAFKSAHNQEQSSYSNLISQMANSGADAWVFIAYQQGFSTMVNNAFESGYGQDVAFYGADSVRGETVLNNTPEGSMNGMKIVTPSAPVEQENYQQFASDFQEEYDQEPTSWAAYAYDCVIVSALSILAADEFSGAAMGEVVREVTRPEGEKVTSFEQGAEILQDGGSASDIDYQGVSGPVDLDENGDPKGFLQVLQVQDHSYVGIDFIAG
jgi:branched-chain amino acid transport system substrate-binding protein